MLSTPVFLGFPGSSDSKESACYAGDPSSIPGSGSSPGEGIGYPVQYSWASLVARMVKKKKKKKNPPAMWETWVRSLGLGRSFGGMHGNPFQYSCLEIFTDRGGVGSERVGQD